MDRLAALPGTDGAGLAGTSPIQAIYKEEK